MNELNKFAPPKALVEVAVAARPKASGSYVLAGLTLLQSLAMLAYANLLFEMIRTGESNVASGLGVARRGPYCWQGAFACSSALVDPDTSSQPPLY